MFRHRRSQGLDFYLRSLYEATDVRVTTPCPITRFLLQRWRVLRERHCRGEISAVAVAAELQGACEEELARVQGVSHV